MCGEGGAVRPDTVVRSTGLPSPPQSYREAGRWEGCGGLRAGQTQGVSLTWGSREGLLSSHLKRGQEQSQGSIQEEPNKGAE